MRIRNKLKPNLVNEIIELRDSREYVFNFVVNFLENVGLRYDFIHTLLKDCKSKDKKNTQTIKMAAGLYLSSLVTCWETFFRDIMVFVVEEDVKVKEKVLNFLLSKGIKEEDVRRHGISLGEFMCKQFNFQELNDTRDAFNFLFSDNKACITEFMNNILSNEIVFSSPNFILYWLQQKDDVPARIEEILIKTFNTRHRVIHDANFIFEIDVEFMTKVEDCFVIFPQIISFWLAERYNQKRSAIDKENKNLRLIENLDTSEAYFVFSRQDFEAEYVIVD